jgi:uncharacterized protein
MKLKFSAVAMVFLLACTAVQAEPTTQEVMKQNFMVSRFTDSKASADLKLISAQGDVRARSVSSASRIHSNGVDNTRLTRFTAPADVAGMATLTVEETGSDDKIWVYLPSMRKTRRIQASDKNKPFLGTDFSYGDVMGFRVEEWTYGAATTEIVDGKATYRFDAKPANAEVASSSGYSLRRMWVDKSTFVALKTEAYDAGGKLLKRLIASDVKLMDPALKRYQPMLLSAENVQTGHKTEIRFTQFKANVGIAEKDLTVEALEMRQ